MLGKVLNLQERSYELPNDGEWDLIRDGLLEIERRRWAAVLKQFHNLLHLEMIGIFGCHIKKIERNNHYHTILLLIQYYHYYSAYRLYDMRSSFVI